MKQAVECITTYKLKQESLDKVFSNFEEVTKNVDDEFKQYARWLLERIIQIPDLRLEQFYGVPPEKLNIARKGAKKTLLFLWENCLIQPMFWWAESDLKFEEAHWHVRFFHNPNMWESVDLVLT